MSNVREQVGQPYIFYKKMLLQHIKNRKKKSEEYGIPRFFQGYSFFHACSMASSIRAGVFMVKSSR